jgi:hypothetical protein
MLEDVWTNLPTELDSNRGTRMSWRVLLKESHRLACLVCRERGPSNLLRWNYLNIVYLHTEIANKLLRLLPKLYSSLTWSCLADVGVVYPPSLDVSSWFSKLALFKLCRRSQLAVSRNPTCGHPNSHESYQPFPTPGSTRVFFAFSSRSLQRSAVCSAV